MMDFFLLYVQVEEKAQKDEAKSKVDCWSENTVKKKKETHLCLSKHDFFCGITSYELHFFIPKMTIIIDFLKQT